MSDAPWAARLGCEGGGQPIVSATPSGHALGARRLLFLLAALGVAAAPAEVTAQSAEAVPPTDQLSLALARNAKSFCSGVFVVGRSAEETLASADLQRWTFLDWFDWDDIEIDVDHDRKTVTLTRPPAPPRTAAYHGAQGCTILPPGADGVEFTPVAVAARLPSAATTPWPMGDLTRGQTPRGIDLQAVEAVLEEVFERNTGERAWVVVHDGKIAAERYAPGFDKDTRNLNFSMGKSLTSTLIGMLVKDGHLDVKQPAPIEEWRAPDARSLVTVENLLHMSGGLDCNSFGAQDPRHFTHDNHHHLVYNEGVDVFRMSSSRGLLYVPGTVYRYRNCDTLVLGRIIREIVEAEYDVGYLEFPQRMLFDRIGARSFVLEPDPHGNFVMSGHNYATARDWARVGLLYLQDGVWQGERILPEGWVRYATTPSPANRGYGAQWWLATPGDGLPADAFWASGAEGQQTMVIPSANLVVAMAAFGPSTERNPLLRRISEAVVGGAADCASGGWRKYNFEDEASCAEHVRSR